MQRLICLIALLATAAAAGLPRALLAFGAPIFSASGLSTINAILAKGIKVQSLGEKTQPTSINPTQIGGTGAPNGLTSAPTGQASAPGSTILFQCRAVGQQVWTTGSDGKYANTGAQADLWCGPGGAKIAIRHEFINASTGAEAFLGGMPSFQAVDGSGIVVATKTTSVSNAPPRAGDGGFGSVADTLLSAVSSRGTFSDVTSIIRNNELGGQLPTGLTPLAVSSADLEAFALTGAEGVPNAPLLIPYQADYTFFTGRDKPAFPQSGPIVGSSPASAGASANAGATASGGGSASAAANATAISG